MEQKNDVQKTNPLWVNIVINELIEKREKKTKE